MHRKYSIKAVWKVHTIYMKSSIKYNTKINFLGCKHWKWLIQNFITKHWEKWEHCDAVATAQTTMECHGVLSIWENSGNDLRSKEALGKIVWKTMKQKFVNWLFIYQHISVHWNWHYHMDWDSTLCLQPQPLSMKVIWQNFNSETIRVIDFISVCGTAQPHYSWNGTIWHLNRGCCG